MLAALLLASIIAAPLASVALFVRRPVLDRGGAWGWVRRFVAALLATCVLAVLVAGILVAIGATRHNVAGAAAGIVIMSLLWMPVTRRWRAAAHVCWSSTVLLFVSYLAFMWHWTLASHLGAAGTAGGILLWVLEVWAGVLACAYLWELCDALGRERWRRRVIEPPPPPAGVTPFVSLHVPAYNEPPDMVIETLQSLKQIDYPAFEIVAIDDNSTDASLWRPVEAWCAANGVTFAHLDDWPGYKSGALNYALTNLTDPRAELVGVVDADYQLDPQFLRRCAPLFSDPAIGFIQAPQDYRDWDQAPYYRRLYYSYTYFFAVSQPSRNERDGAIFAGTTGLIRRSALDAVGGWDEWCITEDAELSLRLLKAGWSGLHVDRSFGHGIMPLTFEALKGQRFRWCFGGIQILRHHWRSLLPGPKTADNQMDLGQRWAYLSGALQWYGDLLGLIFFGFLLAGAINVALGGGLLFRKLTGFLVAAIPVLVVLGLARAVALLRRGTGASWREALGAFMIWQSTALVVARASVQGLFAREAEFLRTPKTTEESSWWEAIRGNRAETVLALVGLAGIAAGLTATSSYAGPLTAGLLLWPTLAFAAAPCNSLAARRASLPVDLRARRASEYARTRTAAKVTVAAGGLAAAGAAAAGVLALIAPSTAPVLAPQLVAPAQGHPVRYHVTRPATTPTTVTPASSTTTPTTRAGRSTPTTTTPAAPTTPRAPTTTRLPTTTVAPATTAAPAATATPTTGP